MGKVLIPIPGRLHSAASEGHVAGADEIFDDNKGKNQSQINTDVDTEINNIKGGSHGSISSLQSQIDDIKGGSTGSIASLTNDIATVNSKVSANTAAISTNTSNINKLKDIYEGLTQSDIVVGTLPATGVAKTIYRVPDKSSYADYMWNGSSFVKMAEYNNGIDDVPTAGSNNLVASGATLDLIGEITGKKNIVATNKQYFQEGFYYTNEEVLGNFHSDSRYRSCLLKVYKGATFKINKMLSSSTNAAAYSWLDKEKRFIMVGPGAIQDLEIVAPSDGYLLLHAFSNERIISVFEENSFSRYDFTDIKQETTNILGIQTSFILELEGTITDDYTSGAYHVFYVTPNTKYKIKTPAWTTSYKENSYTFVISENTNPSLDILYSTQNKNISEREVEIVSTTGILTIFARADKGTVLSFEINTTYERVSIDGTNIIGAFSVIENKYIDNNKSIKDSFNYNIYVLSVDSSYEHRLLTTTVYDIYNFSGVYFYEDEQMESLIARYVGSLKFEIRIPIKTKLIAIVNRKTYHKLEDILIYKNTVGESLPSAIRDNRERIVKIENNIESIINQFADYSSSEYGGNKVPIYNTLHYKRLMKVKTKNSYVQGLAINNDVIFVAENGGFLHLININNTSGESFAEYQLETSSHCGTIAFSDEKYDEADNYPVLYVMDSAHSIDKDDADNPCQIMKVFRVSDTGSEIVQTVKLRYNVQANGWGNISDVFTVDPINRKFYIFRPKLQEYNIHDNNTYIFTEYNLPRLTDGNNVEIQPVRTFSIPYPSTPVGNNDYANPQGLACTDKVLYLSVGRNTVINNLLYVVDINTGNVINILSYGELVYIIEPEGSQIYKGEFYNIAVDSVIHKVRF